MRVPERIGEPKVVWRHEQYANKVVSEQTFRYPDGTLRDFYLWGKVATKPVVIFPITRDGRVIVVRQWRPGSDSIIYEFPGGNKKPDQKPEEILAEELREETGYKAGRIIALPEFWLDAASYQVPIAGYLALDCVRVGEPKPEKSEVIEKVEMSIGDWIAFSQSRGENQTDAKTLAIMWLALPYLQEAGLIDFAMKL